MPLVRGTFERAVRAWSIAPALHHSDRGGQYASAEARRMRQRRCIRPNVSRSACPYDKAREESVSATLKPNRT